MTYDVTECMMAEVEVSWDALSFNISLDAASLTFLKLLLGTL